MQPLPSTFNKVVDANRPPTVFPGKYSEFAAVCEKKSVDSLPPHRPYDFSIDLQPGKQPPYGPIYSLTEAELCALRHYIDDNLAKGFIRHSKSPASAPILFTEKKSDKSLRLCVDYRGLNNVTVRNRYPLPLPQEIFSRLRSANFFTKLDLPNAFNLLRVKEGDEWKTAFRTRLGHFEYLVMPFGHCNSPGTFQHFINDILRPYLDTFVIVYLDDIVIYSASREEHTQHVKTVLRCLLENNLSIKLEKCSFDTQQIKFLGFVISPSGITMDTDKVKAVLDWQPPQRLEGLRRLLGFANFYRRFILNYADVVYPLTRLLRKNVAFKWSDDANAAFTHLKRLFTTAPILAHADPSRPYTVETDSSDFALGAVLSQRTEDGLLHPVAFYSRQLLPAEVHYQIGDKELLAIKAAFTEWRQYLMGTEFRTQVLTDHENLRYYLSTHKLNRRQVRWWEFFSDYYFDIVPRPGSKQAKSDALSRREELQQQVRRDEDIAQKKQTPMMIVASPDEPFVASALPSDTDLTNPPPLLIQSIRAATLVDEFAQRHKQRLADGVVTDCVEGDGQSTGVFTFDNQLLYHNGLLYVPDNASRVAILQSRHDSPLSGHVGQRKTLELVSRDYWWPGMRSFIEEYVRSCSTCGRSKHRRHKPHGLLQPLPTPNLPWRSISMDFMFHLPPSSGFTAILVIVDRFTKMAHFIACKDDINAEETALLLSRHIFPHHGIPSDITSDRGSQFISKFWQRYLQLLHIDSNLSTAYHPESDGQTENVNGVLVQYLRCYTSYEQDDWYDYLHLAEFAYNNSTHSSTLLTPFYANYGYNPLFDLSPSMAAAGAGASASTSSTTVSVPLAEERIQQLQLQWKTMVTTLDKAKTTYKRYADKHRKAAPIFGVGDLVLLNSKNIRTTRPMKKLDYKFLGPFAVKERIGNLAYRLDLPSSYLIHDVFHVSLLEPYTANTLPDRIQPPPPAVIVDGQEEFNVEAVLDSRFIRRRLHYLVHWTGYDNSERSWEPASHFHKDDEVIADFHRTHPDKPKLRRSGVRRSRRG